MTDIFISYARSSEPLAIRIADDLRGLGFGVWRDDELPAHRKYAEVIEERLTAAKAVIVLWSADAAKSEWVQSEADHARNADKLVQVRVDRTPLPMPFDRFQCTDLCDWTGDLDAPEWVKVVASISKLAGGDHPPPALQERTAEAAAPTIAVMPFKNLSDDAEQAYFVEGMREEIVAALARFKSLYVVAAASTLLSRGMPLSPQIAARGIGVRYLLEGSVRHAGAMARITLHLVDAASGAEVWTDRLEDRTGDVFALQDQVAERVAGVIEGVLLDADQRKLARRPTQHVGSYDLYLRAMYLFRVSRRRELLRAIELLDEAIAIDPNYALALSQAAVCLRQVVDHGWMDDLDAARAKGLGYAERALRLAADDPSVLAQVGISLPGLEDKMGRALSLLERAAALNPNSGFVWLAMGSAQLRNGNPEAAAEHLERGMRLDPISSLNGFMRMYLASARFQQRRFDEALALYQTTAHRLPLSFAILASLHGHLGQMIQAREALAEFEAHDAGPIDKFARIWFPRPEYRQVLMDGIEAVQTAPAP